MQRTLTKMLALAALLLALAACAPEPQNETSGETTPANETTPSAKEAEPANGPDETAGTVQRPDVTVGFSQIGAESGWRTANTNSFKQAAKDLGINFKFSDAQGKQEHQIKAIRSFIAQGVDVIVLAPIVETGWDVVLKEAKRAGIPVILSDRRIDVEDDSLYATFVGPDAVEEGRMAARWLAEKVDGEARIVELQGTPGSAPAIERQTGFLDVLQDYPDMQIVDSQSGDFRRSGGKEVMAALLKKHPGEIDAVFAHNDDMALGAIQAIEEAGLEPGEDILLVSIDGLRSAFEAMIAGDLNCTVECNPLLGPTVLKTAIQLADGEETPKVIRIEDRVFDQSVAAEEIGNRQY